jgi:hypothetical protein
MVFYRRDEEDKGEPEGGDNLMLEEMGETMNEDDEDDQNDLGERIDGILDQLNLPNLEMVPCDDTNPPDPIPDRTSNTQLHAIVTSNFPKHVKHEEEAQLFLELYQKHVRNGKLNTALMAEKWNTYILEKVQEASNPKDVLQIYRFKTPQQIKAFKEKVEKKLAARAALHQYGDAIKKLQGILTTTTDTPVQRDLIVTRHNVDMEDIVPVPRDTIVVRQDADETNVDVEPVGRIIQEDPSSSEITKQSLVISNHRPASNQSGLGHIVAEFEQKTGRVLESDFLSWALNPSIHICGVCLTPRRVDGSLTADHGEHSCKRFDRGPTNEEKNAIFALKRQIARRSGKK